MNAFEILNTGNLTVAAALIPIVVGLVQAIKMIGLPNRFAPVLSVITGIGLSFLFRADMPVQVTVLYGLLAGLGAAGLYSGVKTSAGVQ